VIKNSGYAWVYLGFARSYYKSGAVHSQIAEHIIKRALREKVFENRPSITQPWFDGKFSSKLKYMFCYQVFYRILKSRFKKTSQGNLLDQSKIFFGNMNFLLLNGR